MEPKYYANWHLAKNERELLVTEFEWSVIRFHEAFVRWVSSTGSVAVDGDIKYSEHLILHVIRMQNRPKTSAMIARLINRDDLPNIQYSLRKLDAAKLIEKSKETTGKTSAYSVTELGKKVTDNYAQIRSDLLINAIGTLASIEDRMADITQMMGVLTGIYEEMARNTSTYSPQY